MELIGERVKERREALDITQDELADKLGYKSRSSISKIESGKNEIPLPKLVKIAETLSTSSLYLIGATDNADKFLRAPDGDGEVVIGTIGGIKSKRIDVYGFVRAGLPILAQENIVDTEDISMDSYNNGEYFGLRVRGDSMEPRIHEGDTLIVRKQSYANNGDIVIALKGEEANVKMYKVKSRDEIFLVSLNEKYDPIEFTYEWRIIGRVVESRAKFS